MCALSTWCRIGTLTLTPSPDTVRAVQSDRLALMDHEYLGLGDIQRASGHTQLFDSLYL